MVSRAALIDRSYARHCNSLTHLFGTRRDSIGDAEIKLHETLMSVSSMSVSRMSVSRMNVSNMSVSSILLKHDAHFGVGFTDSQI